jgi:hypothetical protein
VNFVIHKENEVKIIGSHYSRTNDFLNKKVDTPNYFRLENYFNVDTKSTMTQGDCMYSSVYRAAKAQNLYCVLDSIKSFEAPIPGNLKNAARAASSEDEMLFVQKARYNVSKEIIPDVINFYEQMVDSFINNRDVYEYNVGEYSTLVRQTITLIKKYIEKASTNTDRIRNKDLFLNDYVNNIVNLDSSGKIPAGRIYSGELEYTGLQRILLNTCGVNLISISSELNKSELQVQANSIYIENQGGGHYEYFLLGEKLPDRDPTVTEIIRRASRYIPKVLLETIINESGPKITRIVDKIIEVWGGIPRGINKITNKNFSEEYLRIRNRRPPGMTLRSR